MISDSKGEALRRAAAGLGADCEGAVLDLTAAEPGEGRGESLLGFPLRREWADFWSGFRGRDTPGQPLPGLSVRQGAAAPAAYGASPSGSCEGRSRSRN